VYFAETENPDPQILKWWYWKDKKDKPQGNATALMFDEHEGIDPIL
jgi:hypothetical protein